MKGELGPTPPSSLSEKRKKRKKEKKVTDETNRNREGEEEEEEERPIISFMVSMADLGKSLIDNRSKQIAAPLACMYIYI